MRIAHFRNLEAEYIIWLESHAQIGYDDVILLHAGGIKVLGEPLQALHRPAILQAPEQMRRTWVLLKLDKLVIVQQRVIPLIVVLTINGQHPPQQGVEWGRCSQKLAGSNVLLLQGIAGRDIDMHFRAQGPQ